MGAIGRTAPRSSRAHRRHVTEYGGFIEEAAIEARRPLAAMEQLSATVLVSATSSSTASSRRFVVSADIDAGRHASPSFSFFVTSTNRLAKRSTLLSWMLEARRRNADLPGVAELGLGRHVGRVVDVGVVEDDDGAWPPSSMVTRFMVSRRLQQRSRPVPSRSPSPCAPRRGHDARGDDVDVAVSRLTTPGGRPASWQHCTMRATRSAPRRPGGR